MSFLPAVVVCLAVLVLLGLVERILRDRAWKAVPIRIHVNGTRGKSTVTRLIWSALREAGIPALAKTTGATPRLLMPDGTERPLRRRGKASIREQVRTLFLAKRVGARALVVECMALAPELQWTSEHSMIRATIGVITNARIDHTEIMGQSVEEIAACLGNTIPRNAVLVTGDVRWREMCERIAATRGTRVVVAEMEVVVVGDDKRGSLRTSAPTAAELAPWQQENQMIALAVTRELAIADEVALAGMQRAPADPGEMRQGLVKLSNKEIPFLDVRKANDPDSFLRVVETLIPAKGEAGAEGKQLLVYNHRDIRPQRLLDFASLAFSWKSACRIVVTGDRPAWTSWRTIRGRAGLPPVEFVSSRRLPAVLKELAPQLDGIVFCGNIQGLDLSQLLAQR